MDRQPQHSRAYKREYHAFQTPNSTAPPPPPATSTTPPAYAPGTCSFRLKKWQNCDPDTSNIFEVTSMLDNNKNDIGDTPVYNTNPLGELINAKDPFPFFTKLPYRLVIVGEHQDDYVNFNYNGLQWTSRTTTGPAACKVGG